MVLTVIGGIGYVLLAAVDSVGVRYFGTFLAASGIFPSESLGAIRAVSLFMWYYLGIANILPWVTSKSFTSSSNLLNVTTDCGFPDNQGSDTRRGAGIVLLNLIGQCGVRSPPLQNFSR